jgi:hypothetical protein
MDSLGEKCFSCDADPVLHLLRTAITLCGQQSVGAKFAKVINPVSD